MPWQPKMRMTENIARYILENGEYTNRELREMVYDEFEEWFSEGTIAKVKRGEYDHHFPLNSAEYDVQSGRRGRRSSNSNRGWSSNHHSNAWENQEPHNGAYTYDDDEDEYDEDDDDEYQDAYEAPQSTYRQSQPRQQSYQSSQSTTQKKSYQPTSAYTGTIHVAPEDNPFSAEYKGNTQKKSYQPTSAYTGTIHVAPEDNPFSPEYQGRYHNTQKKKSFNEFSADDFDIDDLKQFIQRNGMQILMVCVVLGAVNWLASLVFGKGLVGALGDEVFSSYWAIRLVYHRTIANIGKGFFLGAIGALAWHKFMDNNMPFFFDLSARHVALSLALFGVSCYLFAYCGLLYAGISFAAAVVCALVAWFSNY